MQNFELSVQTNLQTRTRHPLVSSIPALGGGRITLRLQIIGILITCRFQSLNYWNSLNCGDSSENKCLKTTFVILEFLKINIAKLCRFMQLLFVFFSEGKCILLIFHQRFVRAILRKKSGTKNHFQFFITDT